MAERNAEAYEKLRDKIDAAWEMNRDLQFALGYLVQYFPSAPFDAYRDHLSVLRTVVDHVAWSYAEVERAQANSLALTKQEGGNGNG